MDAPCLVVFVTVPNRADAAHIADVLVRERLAACCTLIPGAQSTYRWEGKVAHDEEVLMIVKTSHDRFEALRERIVALHSYSVPEIIALPITAGHQPYVDWVAAETRQ